MASQGELQAFTDQMDIQGVSKPKVLVSTLGCRHALYIRRRAL